MSATFDQALTLARQLTVQEQARLIAVLAETLAGRMEQDTPAAPGESSMPEAWARLFALSDEIRATYPHANPAARLEADRREREALLHGYLGVDDVHP